MHPILWFKSNPILMLPMNILSWNVQGAGSDGFRRAFMLLRHQYNPNIVVLCEPRISGSAADAFIKKSGFEHSFRVEAQGFSGGIWIMWDRGLDIQILSYSKQFIHAEISLSGEKVWMTFVYGSPVSRRRKKLWEALNNIASGCKCPWMIGGDFNSILRDSEKRGGATRRQRACNRFNKWIFTHGLVEIKTDGTPFTWFHGTISEKLDRFIQGRP